MAITTAFTNQGKKDFLNGTHLPGNTYKVALIKVGATGTFDKNTTSYTSLSTDEASGSNYTAGGATVTGFTVTLTTDTASLDFNDATWASATVSAIGAILYNDTATGHGSVSKPVIGVFDFGGTVSSTNGTYTVQIPSSGTGLFRIT